MENSSDSTDHSIPLLTLPAVMAHNGRNSFAALLLSTAKIRSNLPLVDILSDHLYIFKSL